MTPQGEGPLAGRTVVVTRAAEQGRRLVEMLGALGADVVELPLIEVVDPDDGGASLAMALADVRPGDWVVVTSPNGASRVAAAARGTRPPGVKIAAVGEATSAALGSIGPADLVAVRAIAEGVVEALAGEPPGRALVVHGDRARTTVVDGLRARGWDVRAVIAYRTIAARPAAAAIEEALAADAITFASGSTVRSFVDAAGAGRHPRVVVSIGPETTAAAHALGLPVTATADPHTLGGLVASVCSALAAAP